jgi:hypothetical protein
MDALSKAPEEPSAETVNAGETAGAPTAEPNVQAEATKPDVQTV